MSVEVHDADPLRGKKLGDYVIDQLVGEGGMGLVYRAVHPLIGRQVAVKILRPEMASDPEQTQRFLAEARALSAVKHRGVIDVISFGHLEDGRQYMVMEFLDGEALDALLQREGTLSPTRALSVVDEVLDALSAAHKAGVVHRDIKPSNVFLLRQSNGTRVVKVVDFGLARRAALADLSRTGDKASLRAGTPEYISPEQVRGLAATPRSDLYSVGVMLFELVSGRLPFEDRDVMALIEAHVRRPAPSLASVVGGLPEDLTTLVAHLLEKTPEDRPESAEIVRTSLQRVQRVLREQNTQVSGQPPRASKPHGREDETQPSGTPLRPAKPNRQEEETRVSAPPARPGELGDDGRATPGVARSATAETSPDAEPVPARAAAGETDRVLPTGRRWGPVAAVLALVVVALGAGLVVTAAGSRDAPATPLPSPPVPAQRAIEPPPEPPPAPATEPEEPLAPLALPAPGPKAAEPVPPPSLKKRPVDARPGPSSACVAADWRAALRTQISQVQQEAFAQKRVTPAADAELGAIYQALRGGDADCPTLEGRLRRWRGQYLSR